VFKFLIPNLRLDKAAEARSKVWTNLLYHGDSPDVLRRHIPDNSIDLIYLDPPFGTGQKRKSPKRSLQKAEFSDSYSWNERAQSDFEALRACGGDLGNAIRGLFTILGRTSSFAYVVALARALRELHHVLKETGSIYLHCDYRNSAYLRVLLDSLFGRSNFRSEIIWHYTGGGRSKKYFSRKHDTIFFYTKSEKYTFNIDAIRVPYKETSGYAKSGITSKAGKKYVPNPAGTALDDVWDIPILNPMSRERLPYPTQKPEILLERIILASSNPCDVVLDPFCGCGTTLAVAWKLSRNWIGIDSSRKAIDFSLQRLAKTGCTEVERIDAFAQPVPAVTIWLSEEMAKT
jgi:site-specific DNA-methyltransferase (adenine-specific)